MQIEEIAWIAVADELPDDDTTVMIYCPGSDEPVWLGWHDEDGWHEVDASPIGDDEVRAWADIPNGPEL